MAMNKIYCSLLQCCRLLCRCQSPKHPTLNEQSLNKTYFHKSYHLYTKLIKFSTACLSTAETNIIDLFIENPLSYCFLSNKQAIQLVSCTNTNTSVLFSRLKYHEMLAKEYVVHTVYKHSLDRRFDFHKHQTQIISTKCAANNPDPI